MRAPLENLALHPGRFIPPQDDKDNWGFLGPDGQVYPCVMSFVGPIALETP